MDNATSELQRLSDTQRAALRCVEVRAAGRRSAVRARLADRLRGAECRLDDLDAAMEGIRAHARVVLNFHPDRLSVQGRSVAEQLLDDGVYRSQFETGLSSGSLTAFPGGERDAWEDRLFDGAYHESGFVAEERPKYGALDLMHHADGPAPRFGSCYLVLRREVSERSSLTFGGSQEPLALEQSGTLAVLDCVMAAIVEAIERDGACLGIRGLSVPVLLEHLSLGLGDTDHDPAARKIGRALDSFVEAQVHGPIDLGSDADWLVADPAFRGTATGELLEKISVRYDIVFGWHAGFRLAVGDVPDDFRGPAMPGLARRIAGDGIVDAATIGAAAASLDRDPASWRDWGCHAESLQHLKQLWHVLVEYGTPSGRSRQ